MPENVDKKVVIKRKNVDSSEENKNENKPKRRKRRNKSKKRQSNDSKDNKNTEMFTLNDAFDLSSDESLH